MTPGKLLLIPVPLGDCGLDSVLPESVRRRASQLGHFVAENAKSARAFLKTLPLEIPLQQLQISELNEHTPTNAVRSLLNPLIEGHDIGVISEAGCPAVADPGAKLVALAHEAGIQVVPLVGPSSILLALMGSGLSGQNFAFHGYLPAKEDARERKIRELETDSRREQRTQIFIETPYRNRQIFESLLKTCASQTKICVASELTLGSESITTLTTEMWRKREVPTIDRRPTVFLLQA